MTGRKPSRWWETSDKMTHPSLLAAGPVRLLVESCELYLGTRCIALSTVECLMMRVLIEQHQRVVTRSALMIAAWGSASVERTTLVEEHIARLRSLLGEEAAIVTVPGIGYSLR